MYRNSIAFLVGLIAVCLCFAEARAQSGSDTSSRRADGRPIQIEKDDIFDRLAPTQPEEIVVPSTADESPGEEAPLLELQSNEGESKSTLVDSQLQTVALPRNVASFRGQSGADFASPLERDAFIIGGLTAFSQDELRQLILSSAVELSNDLGTVHFGDRWQNFLRLGDFHELLEHPTAEADRTEINRRNQELYAILKSYDRLGRDKQFDVITNRNNFILLRHTLSEYLSLGAERDARAQTYGTISQLVRSLEPVPTGRQWQEYFQLPQVTQLLATPRPHTRAEKGQLQLILSRFETAVKDPQFKKIAQLPGFEETHQRLQLSVAVVDDAETDAIGRVESETVPTDLKGALPMRLNLENGLTFVQQREQESWELADSGLSLTSGDLIKTNEEGVARLIVGTQTQILLSPNTLLGAKHIANGDQIVTEIVMLRGHVKLITSAQPDLSPDAIVQPPIAILYKGHRITPSSQELELNLREEPRTERVIASVYAGSILVAHGAGDEVTIRPGREAVMLPAGIAIRAAAKKPDAWWPNAQTNNARVSRGEGFSR